MFSSSKKLLPLCFLVFWLIGFGVVGGCAVLNLAPPKVPIDIPPRPELVVCPERPQLQGRIIELEDGSWGVLLTPETAMALRVYLNGYRLCAETNTVMLEGHIEKLENRLEAVGANAE